MTLSRPDGSGGAATDLGGIRLIRLSARRPARKPPPLRPPRLLCGMCAVQIVDKVRLSKRLRNRPNRFDLTLARGSGDKHASIGLTGVIGSVRTISRTFWPLDVLRRLTVGRRRC